MSAQAEFSDAIRSRLFDLSNFEVKPADRHQGRSQGNTNTFLIPNEFDLRKHYPLLVTARTMLGASLAFVGSALFLGSSPDTRTGRKIIMGDKTSSSSKLLSTASSTGNDATSTKIKRAFTFVPYGSSFPVDDETSNHLSDRPTITCDGRIARTDGGPHLELTHWTNHETPHELYADTSTQIALNLAKLRNSNKQKQDGSGEASFQNFDNALVINNHFDSDGVLSVFASVDPDTALEHGELMIQGAEAGDFGEWSSDLGVKLDCTLLALAGACRDDEEAYASILPRVPEILHDFESNEGKSFEHSWRSGGWDQAVSDWNDIQEGRVKLERFADSRLVIVHEKQDGPSLLSPYALDRGLRQAGLWSGTTRILRAIPQSEEDDDETSFSYEYEKIGHGWIQQVVQRHSVPDVADKGKLVQDLQDRFPLHSWSTGGSNGLVSLCQATTTTTTSSSSPAEVAQALVQLDGGAAASP